MAAGAKSAAGLTEPAKDAILGAPVAGIIGAHFFAEGDAVKAGAVIMELRKDLELIRLQQRKTLLDAAKADLDRTRKLSATTRSVSAEALEQAVVDHAIADAEFRTAEVELKLRQIVAPFDGTISDLFRLESGEIARLQSPLVRLVDPSTIVFITHVDAPTAASLSKGTEVSLQIGTERFDGKVAFVSPLVDSSSGLLRVRAEFDNRDGRIRPGVEGIMSWGSRE